MILVNALASIPSDINYRIYIRNQFAAAGMQSSLLPKLEILDHNLIDMQIEAFKDTAESDMEDAFGEDLSIESPSELLDLVMENLSDTTKGIEYLVSTLKHLLWIKGDPDTK
jgi:hypothetical protein